MPDTAAEDEEGEGADAAAEADAAALQQRRAQSTPAAAARRCINRRSRLPGGWRSFCSRPADADATPSSRIGRRKGGEAGEARRPAESVCPLSSLQALRRGHGQGAGVVCAANGWPQVWRAAAGAQREPGTRTHTRITRDSMPALVCVTSGGGREAAGGAERGARFFSLRSVPWGEARRRAPLSLRPHAGRPCRGPGPIPHSMLARQGDACARTP